MDAETCIIYNRKQEDSSSTEDSGFFVDDEQIDESNTVEKTEEQIDESNTVEKTEELPTGPRTKTEELPTGPLLRTWSNQRSFMTKSSRRLILDKEEDETWHMYKIRERQLELAQVAKSARRRAQEAAQLVSENCTVANLDALNTVALFFKKENIDLHKQVRAHLQQIQSQQKLLVSRHAPNLLYATQLHDIAARHYIASLQAAWARSGIVSTHLQTPNDHASWHKRWADERDWGLSTAPTSTWLLLQGSRLRAFKVDRDICTNEARGFPLHEFKKQGLIEIRGRDGKFCLTLGKQILRIDRSCGTFARNIDDVEPLAVIEAEASLRLDRASRCALEAPFIILFNDITAIAIAPNLKLPSQKRPSLYDRLLVGSSSQNLEIGRDSALDPRSFSIFFHDIKIIFTSPSTTDAIAWVLEICASFGKKKQVALLDIQSIKGGIVRNSLAPKAPSEAFDLVIHDAIYTFLPSTLDDKSRWIVALQAAAKVQRVKHDDHEYLAQTRHLLNTSHTREPDNINKDIQNIELEQIIREAAQCVDDDQAKELTAKLNSLEQKHLSEAALARETAVALRRRYEAEKEKQYLSRPTSGTNVKSNTPQVIIFQCQGQARREPRIEAKEFSKQLALGRMVLVSLIESSPQLKFEYISIDPLKDDDLEDDTSMTLFDRYQMWKSKFSLKTDESIFRDAVEELIADQAERWQSALAALQLRHDNSSVLAFIRLLDGPEEYARPPRDGDVAIIYSAGVSDRGFNATFADRTQTAAPVVAAAISWLDKNRALAQRFLRVDSDSTDQDEHSPLAYTKVMRLLFQQAILR
uniref:PH domain-containing protein n=1 Tax=Aureoumbra lagunensis TaxID=44058 RepID=A0A7S3NQ99_9STRA